MGKFIALLFSFTLIKILFFVFHGPIYGYASNGDFDRQSACVGIWRWDGAQVSTGALLEKPFRTFINNGEKYDYLCLKSVDNLYSQIVKLFHSSGDFVDIREISALKIISLLVLFLLLYFSTSAKNIRIFLVLSACLVFGDIVYLLYVNTLYAEFTVILGAFFSLTAAMIFCFDRDARKKWQLKAALIFTLVLLGGAKMQYIVLAPAMALPLIWISIKDRKYFFASALLIASLGSNLFFLKSNQSEESILSKINIVNNANTFMHAVLPLAKNPFKQIGNWELPEHCNAVVGRNFSDATLDGVYRCPEINKLSRLKLLPLFLFEPQTFIQPLIKEIELSKNLMPDLGYLEIPGLEMSWIYNFAKYTSLSSLVRLLSPQVFLALIGILLFCGFISAGFTLRDMLKKQSIKFFWVWCAWSGGLIFYSFFSSVFGDGYKEPEKHNFCILLGIIFLILGLLFGIVEWRAKKSN